MVMRRKCPAASRKVDRLALWLYQLRDESSAEDGTAEDGTAEDDEVRRGGGFVD